MLYPAGAVTIAPINMKVTPIPGAQAPTFQRVSAATAAKPRAPKWDCGDIGSKKPILRPKADCIYTCVTAADISQLDEARGNLLVGQLLQFTEARGRQTVPSGAAANLLFRDGVLVDVRVATEQDCASGGSCPPCETKECPTSISWWWVIALGATGVYLGSRIK